MTASHTLIRSPLRWRDWLVSAALALASFCALAQVDPPSRVARLNHAEGPVSLASNEGGDWAPAELNRPLTTGDRIWAAQGARAELHIGSTALRLDGQTSVDLMRLDDQTTQLRLTQGRIDLRVRQLWEGERLEIGTANAAFVITRPGDYRLEVDPARDVTRVAVGAGGGTLYGENGETAQLGAAQQLAFTRRNLTQAPGETVAQNDAFDRWAAERDRLEDQSVTARYVSRETPGYQQLDHYGDWQTDATYGAVWYPRVTVVDWAPYRYGQWRWISPWGWTWVDDAPWGFAPFHYGRWARVDSRWCWVPGPVVRRPVYAPALVGFSGANGVQWQPQAGRPVRGWFPLAPGETWQPGYRASARYIDSVNRPAIIHRGNPGQPGYVHQHEPWGVTNVGGNPFERRRPVRVHAAPPPQAFAPALPPNASPRQRMDWERAHVEQSGREHRQMQPQQLPGVRQAISPHEQAVRQQQLQQQRQQQVLEQQQEQVTPAQREAARRQQEALSDPMRRENALRQQQHQQEMQQRQQQRQAQQALEQQQEQVTPAQRELARRQQDAQRDQAQRENAQRMQQQQMEQAQREQAQRQQVQQAAQREHYQREQAQREHNQRMQQQQMEQAQREQAQRQQAQQAAQREQFQREQTHREQAQRQQQQQAQQQMEQAQRQQREQQERSQRAQREQQERAAQRAKSGQFDPNRQY